MLEKIEGFRLSEQVREYVKEAERMVSEYGWEAQDVMPWAGCRIKVTKIIRDLKDYDICTRGSRQYLIGMANGLADILNAWEERENVPKITVRIIKSGHIIRIAEDSLDMFEGLVERI